jgi:hypothetical protein
MNFKAKSIALSFVMLGVLILSNASRAQDDDAPTPPLAPQDEQVAPDDSEFIEKCMAHVPSKLGIELGATLTTQSDHWGLVGRADFAIPKVAKMTGINRIVCKRARGNEPLNFALATGQNIPPLPQK